MGLKWNCLESVTAIGIGVGACALAPFDGGLAAGAVIGGSGLLARIKENTRKAGLDDEALIERMQKVVLRDWDHWEDTQEKRDAVTRADTAMSKYLPQVMLTREELAATATESADDSYPVMAARKIASRLAEHDPIFAQGADGADSLERRFAIEVLERALRAAKNDRDYATFLTLDIAIELARAQAETREAVARADEGSKQRDAQAVEQRDRIERKLDSAALVLTEFIEGQQVYRHELGTRSRLRSKSASVRQDSALATEYSTTEHATPMQAIEEHDNLETEIRRMRGRQIDFAALVVRMAEIGGNAGEVARWTMRKIKLESAR